MTTTKRIEALKDKARIAMAKGDMQKWSDLQRQIKSLESK